MRPLASLLLLLLLPVRGEATKPNIVHIIADDLGWHDVGFHGGEFPTPHLDRLAKESIELERFYVAPICSPTRAGALTGRYPFRFGIWDGVCNPTSRHGLPPEEVTIPEFLADAGYRDRVLLGKWHLGLASTKFHPLNHGFTSFYGHYNGAIDYFSRSRHGSLDWHRGFEPEEEIGYSTELLGDEAARFIEKRRGDSPFYLLVAFNAPHSPLQATPGDLAAVGFDPDGPLARNTDAGLARKENAPGYGEGGKGNTVRQTYGALVHGLDRNVGKILDAIEKTGIGKDTLLVFHSDNGADPKQGGRNQPLRGGKFTTWEGGTRVVALVRWPGALEKAGTFPQSCSYLDLFPTFAAAAGQKSPEGVDGIDLLPGLRDGAKLPERPILLGKDTVTFGSWKLKGDQLFNLDLDPSEGTDGSAEHPERVRELRKHLTLFATYQGPKSLSNLPLPAIWPPQDWTLPSENESP